MTSDAPSLARKFVIDRREGIRNGCCVNRDVRKILASWKKWVQRTLAALPILVASSSLNMPELKK
jgi:hypothetical protein